MPQFEPDGRDALSQLEQMLLWSMRCWVTGFMRGRDVVPRIAEAFGSLAAPAAAGYLDGFMWAIGYGATRQIAVDCPCQTRVSRDEAQLLDVLRLQQGATAEHAARLLDGMLTRSAALVASSSAARLVATLNAAGHVLPPMPGCRRAVAPAEWEADQGHPMPPTLH